MEIHLVSSMTPEDENRLAPSVLAAIEELLKRLPVSYSLRIETVVGQAIHHNHTAEISEEAGPPTPPDLLSP